MDQQQIPLVCPSHKMQYVGVLIVGIFIGGGAVFAYLNQIIPTSTPGGDTKASPPQQYGTSNAPSSSTEIRTVTGTVNKVIGNTITLHPDQHSDVSFEDRTVAITSITMIFKITPKDPKVFQSELASYTKSKAAGGNTPGPEPFLRTPASLKDILNGSLITVVALENIKTAKEFSASEILIQ